MALIVGKRRMTDIKGAAEGGSDIPASMITSQPNKKWCGLTENSDKQTITIPFTPMEKLKATFPTTEDSVNRGILTLIAP